MTTRRRLSQAVALLLAGGLALTACARNEDTADPGGGTPEEQDHFVTAVYEQEAPGDPVSGGTLTFADFVENRSLDPSKTIATGFSGGSPLVAIYDQLIRWNTAEQDWEPQLAESYESNDDHTVWTVTLREGAQFSDGTPVNADAVIGSVNYYLAEQGYDLGVIGPLWKGIEKVDDRTVEFQLTGSWTTFPHMLGQGMGFIVAPAAIEGGTFSEPIGAGPFTFESYAPAEDMVLTANPNYWNGEPYLEKLRFVWIPDDVARADTVRDGASHVGLTNNTEITWDLREEDMNGAVVVNANNTLLMINHAAEGRAGSYDKARQAIGYAIDVELITERQRSGKGMPTKAIFSSWSQWDSGVETLTYDPEKAKSLLEEAKAEGFDGNVEITGVASAQDTILTMTANLEAAGFTVEQDIMRSVVDYTTKLFIERSYDTGSAGLSITEADPYQRLFSSLHSQAFTNILGIKDPELDALIEELRTKEGDDRADVLKRIDERYQEIVPAVTLSAGTNYVYWGDNVHGVFTTSEMMVDFSKAWIQP